MSYITLTDTIKKNKLLQTYTSVIHLTD